MLKIKVKDEVKVIDKLHTNKWWFNGVKRFYTVKVLPVVKSVVEK